MSASDEHDILLRVAKGEKTDRAPVWLMRQVSAAAQCYRSDKLWLMLWRCCFAGDFRFYSSIPGIMQQAV